MSTARKLLGILAGLVLLASPSGCEDHLGEESAQASLFHFGSTVALDERDLAQVEQEILEFFAACHTYAAVTGAARPQEELEELWRNQEQRGYALLKSRAAPNSRHLHLRDRDYLLMLGLEAGHGVWPILTRYNGELTSYIKCPGLEAMSLSCTLQGKIPSVELWSDCDR